MKCQNLFSGKDKNLLKMLPTETFEGSKFFPCGVDPFLEGVRCAGKQTGSHKKLSPF